MERQSDRVYLPSSSTADADFLSGIDAETKISQRWCALPLYF